MRTQDQVIEYFSMTLIRAVVADGAPLIMVYENPEDYPGKFVARLYNGRQSTHLIVLADSLEELREAKPDCMSIFARRESDPLKVAETWL